MNELYFRVKKLYQKEGGKFPAPIMNLTWNYGEKDAEGKINELNIHKVAKEINGYYLEDVYDKTATPPKLLGKKGELCASFVHLAGGRHHLLRQLDLLARATPRRKARSST